MPHPTLRIRQNICDAAYDKVPNGRNGVISIVLQSTYQEVKENKNHSKILNAFRYAEFLLEEHRDQEIIRNRRKFTLDFYQNLNTVYRTDCCSVSF